MFYAVAYLHHNNICHRDIKCENFMLKTKNEDDLKSPGAIKMIDFGLCEMLQRRN